ncbi:MAG: hypothetical protein LW693_13880 [Saprospiraceae bacterium]|nr:hypothetical protein [Saprospiraceae bacterium]
MKETVIQVQHLSKKYRLGEIGTGALSQDIERWWKMRVMGQEDPFLKVITPGIVLMDDLRSYSKS